MPFDGLGNYVAAAAPSFPAVPGTTIVASYYNATINDIVAAFNNVLTRDGQGKPSAAIDWNNQNLSGVAAFNATSITASGAATAASLNVSGAASIGTLTLTTDLSVANGGTGLGTVPSNGQILIGNGSGYTLATLTQGSGITITNGAGTITISASGGGAGTTTNALTFAASGGVAAGTTFNGSVARTIDYSSIGAQPDAPRVQTVASTASLVPTFSNDLVTVTALAAAMNLAAPTGTPVEGKGLVIRIKDNGTARALTYNAIYRAIGVTLPTTTVIGKTIYLGMIYNTADTKWDIVSVREQA